MLPNTLLIRLLSTVTSAALVLLIASATELRSQTRYPAAMDEPGEVHAQAGNAGVEGKCFREDLTCPADRLLDQWKICHAANRHMTRHLCLRYEPAYVSRDAAERGGTPNPFA
jgi:hypothetical protein